MDQLRQMVLHGLLAHAVVEESWLQMAHFVVVRHRVIQCDHVSVMLVTVE
jgi:hypothetical protein